MSYNQMQDQRQQYDAEEKVLIINMTDDQQNEMCCNQC